MKKYYCRKCMEQLVVIIDTRYKLRPIYNCTSRCFIHYAEHLLELNGYQHWVMNEKEFNDYIFNKSLEKLLT